MICEEKDCCGCLACHDICPVNAIQADGSSGFWRPRISKEKCISCGKCGQVCPALTQRTRTLNVAKCYAVWSKNSSVQFRSSSGGVCAELAEDFRRKDGAVCGSFFNPESLCVRHAVLDDIYRFTGSKYVLSSMQGTYRQIAGLLRSKKVLFIGVPCQVHAVQNFCRDNQDNLFTVELLCRGGASPLCFRQHLRAVTSRKILDVTFRGGKYDCWFSVWGRNNRLIYQEAQYRDEYFGAFMRHSIFQEKCYHCPYTGIHRTGDLTVGDFWGLGPDALNLMGRKGVNVVLVNTPKGMELMEIIRDRINLLERGLDEALPENETLVCPTECPSEYSHLWELIRQEGFPKAHREVYPLSPKERIKRPLRRIKRRIKLYIKEILGL